MTIHPTARFYEHVDTLLNSLGKDDAKKFEEQLTNALKQLEKEPIKDSIAVPFSDYKDVRVMPVGDFLLLYRPADGGTRIFLLGLLRQDTTEAQPENERSGT
jgi:hypothetical protein